MGKNTSISLGDYFEALIKALEVGEESGFVENFN
ncbi:type II toxin-antitoxin system ParD family antitoxin [Lacinutrix jangbogonensis]|nr:type II toxin-antitoxin system ParD family antitoxin [Lacinutrix jangbogonensis]